MAGRRRRVPRAAQQSRIRARRSTGTKGGKVQPKAPKVPKAAK